MALSFVQSQSAILDAGSNAPSLTLATTPARGDLLYVEVVVNQNAGNVNVSLAGWTAVPTTGVVDDPGDVKIAAFYKIAGISESRTITASLSSSVGWAIFAAQFHDSANGTWMLDVSAQNLGIVTAASTGTTPTTTQPNEVLVGAIGNKNMAAHSAPTNSFTLAETRAAGSSVATVVSGSLLYRIATSTGAYSAGVTLSTSRAWVAHIATFYSYVPAPPPTLLTEMAFGSGPQTASPTWTDISSYVHGCSWQRGRQNELNQAQAGTGTLMLNDPKSHFDPRNTASPFYPNVRPGTPVRASLIVNGVTYPLFKMFTERQPRTRRVAQVYTERQIDMIDGFAVLANAQLDGATFPVQSSDQRVAAVLDYVEWPASARSIGAGASTIMAAAYHGSDKKLAQDHLLEVTDSENGLFYCDGIGRTVFVGRHALIQNAGYTVSKATFKDIGTGAGYKYVELEPSFDLDQVFNKWTGTREGGLPQKAKDSASQAQYGHRDKQITSLVTTDAEVLNQVQWKLMRFSQPMDRIESITTVPVANPNDTGQVAASLTREIGDQITVLETPPGFGSQQSKDYQIQHLEGHIEPGPLTTMTMTFLLWPAAIVSFWVAGDATLGLAGVSTKAGY